MRKHAPNQQKTASLIKIKDNIVWIRFNDNGKQTWIRASNQEQKQLKNYFLGGENDITRANSK